MSGMPSLSQIKRMSKFQLSPEELKSLIEAKNLVRSVESLDNLTSFLNNKEKFSQSGPSPLPGAAQGCGYYEFDAGKDREGGRGCHRFVFEINRSSRQIEKILYTDEHYAKTTFFLL